MVSSLSDRLRSLGVKVGVSEISSPPKVERYPIEHVLPGSFIETDQGQAYIVEKDYPSNYLHGNQNLLLEASLLPLEKWAAEPGLHELDIGSFVFFDTETSGLSGGTGTYAFLVGAGRFEGDHFHLVQFFMRDPSEEGALLLALEKFLAPCQSLVSFNGKAFDAPLLNTRYALAGWKSPLPSLHHVDLLHISRRLWRDRLPSRTLGNLEVQILGTSRTEEEVPGWMIPQLYFDYLRSGDAREMKNVFYHNAMDVISLAALFKHIARLLEDPLHAANLHCIDQASLAKIFEDLGDFDLAVQLYNNSLTQSSDGLPEELYWETLQRFSFLYKRLGNFTLAMPLWEKAALSGHIYAFVELAKVFEHTLRDYPKAIGWTQQALGQIKKPGFPAYERVYWMQELEHRLERLKRKQAGDESNHVQE
jgi:uncharacterized protein YprB with RNaseH-like and TPR domain